MKEKAIKYFYILLIINTLIRFFIAFFTNLGIDEAYYFSYGLYLDWSYFDHPLMIALVVKASSIFGSSFSAIGLRAVPLIIGTLNILLIFHIGKTIKDSMTGFYAALLFSASFYGSVISGTFVLPDNPLTFFWLLSLLFAIKFFTAEKHEWPFLFFFAIGAGLAFLSKYSALALWFGMLCMALKEKKAAWFRQPRFYLAGMISILLFLPVLIWNINHNFASFSFHGNRMRLEGIVLHFDYFASELAGQVFYNNPINIVIIISCLIYFFRHKKDFDRTITSWLLFTSFPVIFATLLTSFFNRTLPHWSGPAYLSLIIFAALALRQKYADAYHKPIKLALASQAFFGVIIVLGLLQINFGLINPGSNTDEEKLGKNDISLDMYGWKQVTQEMDKMVTADLKSGAIGNNVVFITHNWFPAGHIEFYLANPLKKKLYIWGTEEKSHQYMLINERRGMIEQNSDAYYITTSRYFASPDPNLLNHYKTFDNRAVIRLHRNNKAAFNVFIYRLKEAKSTFSMNN